MAREDAVLPCLTNLIWASGANGDVACAGRAVVKLLGDRGDLLTLPVLLAGRCGGIGDRQTEEPL